MALTFNRNQLTQTWINIKTKLGESEISIRKTTWRITCQSSRI